MALEGGALSFEMELTRIKEGFLEEAEFLRRSFVIFSEHRG